MYAELSPPQFSRRKSFTSAIWAISVRSLSMVKNRPLYHAPGSLIGISWLHPAKLIAHPTLTSAARGAAQPFSGKVRRQQSQHVQPQQVKRRHRQRLVVIHVLHFGHEKDGEHRTSGR